MKIKPKNQNKTTKSNNQKMEGKEKDSVPIITVAAEEDVVETANYNAKYKITFYIMLVLTLIGASSSFWHIFANEDSIIPYFGFNNFSIFLYHFGVHFTLFSFSLFVLWLIGFIPNSAKYIKKLARGCISVFMSISLYFLLWVFIPLWNDATTDYPKNYYRIALAFVSITLTFLLFKLTKASFSYFDGVIKIKSLKSIIRMLFGFIFSETDKKGYVKKSLKRDFIKRRIELVDKAVDNE